MDKNFIFFCSTCGGMKILSYKYENADGKIDLIIKCKCLKDRERTNYTIDNFINNNYISVPRLICKSHNTQYTNWCKNCNINICNKCISSHSSHKLVKLSSILINEKDITSLENKIIDFQGKLLAKTKKVEEIEKFKSKENQEFLINFKNFKKINSKEIEFVTKLKDLYLFLLKNNMICYQIAKNLEYIINKLSFSFIKNEYSDNLDKELNEKDNISDIYYIVLNPLKYFFLPNNDQEEINKKADKMRNTLALERSISNSTIISEINEDYKLNNLDLMNLAETRKLNVKLLHSDNDINEINVYNNHQSNNIQNKIFNDDYNEKSNSLILNNNKINSNNNIFNNNNHFYNENHYNIDKNNSINLNNNNIFNNNNIINNNNIFDNNIIIDNKNYNSVNNNIINNNYNITNNNNILNSLPLNSSDSGFFLFKNENQPNSEQKINKPIYFGKLKNGKYHGDKCKLQYPNGDIYEGSFREGLRHGKGKLINKNNSYCYEGPWAYDKKNGKCREKIGDETFYGTYKNGVRDGKCIIKYNNNDKFEGNFKDGKRDGYGEFIFYETHKTYKGGFKNNLFEGEGEITSDNGYYFKGEFLGGLRHGDNCIEKKDGIKEYKGSFRRDKMNGKGIYRWYSGDNNGDIYEGEFVDDIFEGKGVYQYNYGTKYIGDFLRGVKHGKGKEIYFDGSYFVGEFKEGKKDGEGTFIDSEGNIFKGIYREGKENGQGKITYNNEDTLEGTWLNGLKQGEFIFKNCNGNSFIRKYDKDILIEEKKDGLISSIFGKITSFIY